MTKWGPLIAWTWLMLATVGSLPPASRTEHGSVVFDWEVIKTENINVITCKEITQSWIRKICIDDVNYILKPNAWITLVSNNWNAETKNNFPKLKKLFEELLWKRNKIEIDELIITLNPIVWEDFYKSIEKLLSDWDIEIKAIVSRINTMPNEVINALDECTKYIVDNYHWVSLEASSRIIIEEAIWTAGNYTGKSQNTKEYKEYLKNLEIIRAYIKDTPNELKSMGNIHWSRTKKIEDIDPYISTWIYWMVIGILMTIALLFTKEEIPEVYKKYNIK